MKKSDKKMMYSIILGFIILTLLGIAGSYDQKCGQEDSQAQQQLHEEYQQQKLDSTYESTLP